MITNGKIFTKSHKEDRELVNLPVKLLQKLSIIPFDKRWAKRYAFIMSHRGPARRPVQVAAYDSDHSRIA